MFKERELVIATKHKKEKVIAPILEKELGVKCFTISNLDTDILGTFTGEIERKTDPVTTARNKCLMAMELANCDMAIASEGSFGPHPTIYFAPANEEFLIFIDRLNNYEIISREISLETNFNGADINSEEELWLFAKKIKFPSHALILKNSKENFTEIIKGIKNKNVLKKIFYNFISRYGNAYVETDMRAMYNPTRMKVIKKTTKKLVNKINSYCPECKTPGFSMRDAIFGLPCEKCKLPTQSVLKYIYICTKCNYTKEEIYPNKKHSEDPMYCNNCNP